jgi:hypothetical protein
MTWPRGERSDRCDDVDGASFLANLWRLGAAPEPVVPVTAAIVAPAIDVRDPGTSVALPVVEIAPAAA